MNNSHRQAIIGLMAVLGLLMVIVFYFIYHKPISPTFVLNILISLGKLLIAFGIVSVAGGMGGRLLSIYQVPPLPRLALQTALGVGVLSIIVLILGSTLGLGKYISWILFILLGVVFRRNILDWFKLWVDLEPLWKENNRQGRIILIGLTVVLLVTMFTALAPPIKFDALVYHLSLPENYLDSGKIIYVPENMFWGMPQNAEMNYLLAAALVGIEAAVLVGWLVGIVTLIGMFGYIQYRLGTTTAWVSIGCLMAGFTISSSLAWGYVGWFTILYGLCVIIMLDTWRQAGDRNSLILSGIYTGMALGTKYTAGILLLSSILIIIYHNIAGRQKLIRTLSNITVFFIPVVLVSLAWWIKNFLATGNPFYPFFYPSGAMDSLRLGLYTATRWSNWRDILLLPIRSTVMGVEGNPGFNASIGPLILGLGAFSWVGSRSHNENQRITISTAQIMGLAGLLVWIIAGSVSGLLIQTRLYLSLFTAFAILAGAGFHGLSKIRWSTIRLSRLVSTLIILVFLLNTIQVTIGLFDQNALDFLLSVTSRDDYINHNLGWYGPAMKKIRELPDGSKVLMLWEPRSLYCLPKCIPDEIIDRWAHDRFLYGKHNSILSGWKAEGYSHLLFYKSGADFIREVDERYTNSDWEALEQLLAGLPLIEIFGDDYYLYTLD